MRAIELGQREGVAREMRRHPVEQHADPALVQMVDEERKVLRPAEPVRRREEARDLVTPRALEGMLRHRHDLHVGEAHLDDVVRQRRGQFAVRERTVPLLRFCPPRAEVHLVDRHRPVKLTGGGPPAVDPRGVGPLILARIADDRGVVGRRLEVRAVRVSLDVELPTRVTQLELVELALAEARDKQLPDAGDPERAHRVVTAVPLVEVADDGNARGRRRPDREGHAGHAIHGPQLRPELLVDAMLVAFVEEIEVLRAQRRQKRVRIVEFADCAVGLRGPEPVLEDLGAARDEDLEETLGRLPGHRMALASAALHDLAVGDIAQERPDHNALRFSAGVQVDAEMVVRRGMRSGKQGLKFGLWESHPRRLGRGLSRAKPGPKVHPNLKLPFLPGCIVIPAASHAAPASRRQDDPAGGLHGLGPRTLLAG